MKTLIVLIVWVCIFPVCVSWATQYVKKPKNKAIERILFFIVLVTWWGIASYIMFR